MRLLSGLIPFFLSFFVAAEESPTVPFITTPDEVVQRMLQLAQTRPGDLVVDLGSGDGRIVIAAARAFGARGLGIEIDAGLVEKSRANAVRAGVAERVSFVQGDVLAADPSCAYEPRPGAALVEPARALTYGAEFEPALAWSPAARERVERIPSFVRGVVMQRLEEYARRQGIREITIEMMAEVRSAMPIDFSKRRPFFTEANG